MPIAVGVIETQGFPAILAAADAMVKAGNVAIVVQERSESGRQFVAVRGQVAEVERAVRAGVRAVDGSPEEGLPPMPNEGKVTAHYIVPNPPVNVESVLPINYTEDSEPFRV